MSIIKGKAAKFIYMVIMADLSEKLFYVNDNERSYITTLMRREVVVAPNGNEDPDQAKNYDEISDTKEVKFYMVQGGFKTSFNEYDEGVDDDSEDDTDGEVESGDVSNGSEGENYEDADTATDGEDAEVDESGNEVDGDIQPEDSEGVEGDDESQTTEPIDGEPSEDPTA